MSVTYDLYDLLEHECELYVSGLCEVDDGTCETVVIARVEQLGEQIVFSRVAAHICPQLQLTSRVGTNSLVRLFKLNGRALNRNTN